MERYKTKAEMLKSNQIKSRETEVGGQRSVKRKDKKLKTETQKMRKEINGN